MINTFKKLWYFSEEEQPYIKQSIIINFLGAIFNALQFGGIYYAVLAIINHDVTIQTIAVAILFLTLSIIGVIISKRNAMLKQTHAGYFMAAHKRISLGEKIKRVPMGFFTDVSLGNLTAIATTNLDNIEIWVPTLFVLVVGGLLNSIVFILSLFFFSYKVGLVAVIGSILFLSIIALMQRKSSATADEIHTIQSSLTKEVLTTLQGMQVIKSYNLSGKNNTQLDETINQASKASLSLEKKIVPYALIAKLIIAITIVSMLILSVSSYFSGDSMLAHTIMIFIASFVIFDGLLTSGSALTMLRSVENTIDSYDYVHSIEDMPEGDIDTPIKTHNITFKNVSFSYDKRNILNNISAKIDEHSMTAIVGPSGSGKTTFCNLISRAWDVNSGEILIGDINIKDYTKETLMDTISMVFQDVYLFEDTIENNIKFGKPNANREEIITAAKQARCHEFIMTLPDQYQTQIGEGGASLSGGERQRISIARAMLKDAPIIIFDEATANIDPENEDKLKEAIESLISNKTVIMIAHRLKTIRNADQILVLDNGDIVERGTHDELIDNNGLYNTLIQAKQAATLWKLDN
ncbi:ABC transporter ATP-binding protein [Dolosigranulum pigrum]|uniref:ABC transporter ATP-binding protein n=1 Tax=Dolosigranulum pigrum TaxID=29394 RepID=UPI001AD85904|nr:ABC transporter ATP-binding protein [Dolosigranulum pigrum]QTJ39091.1 ABC transporter ATP-binding protein [Dolosigranulum pigrum]QTJ47580.1 ABC transporter ATP-binding protein [Dolosigranulum pigrum]